MLSLFFIFIISFFISSTLIFLSKIAFSKIDFLNSSNLIEKKKDRFIPAIGGISIYICFLCVVTGYIYFSDVNRGELNVLYGVILGAGIILLIGFLDDMFEFSPLIKLIGQTLASIIVIFFGIHTQIIYVPDIVNLIITILWIVGVVNAFNLLDILDGLAPGIGVIAGMSFFVLSIYTGNFLVGVISVGFVGFLLGFLFFNFPPAKVYLGDSGSMLIGLILSVVALQISYAPEGHEFAIISPMLILGLPLYDMVFVALRRLILKKSVVEKSNDHFIFQLIRRGIKKRKALYIMYGFSLFFSITAIGITIFKNEISLFIFIAFLILFSIINRVLLRKKIVL